MKTKVVISHGETYQIKPHERDVRVNGGNVTSEDTSMISFNNFKDE